MLMKGAQTTDRIDPLPTELDSAQSKLVYLTLEATGGATATDLSETLNMQKLGVLSVLSSLSSAGLIERTDSGYAPAN
ncbi:helix-turn-helix domain-containing protein [Natrinema salaciae]|uniref:Sugar-specific transcriptional regulator TrmB n=1 Tax=Natrinema salaciae TaxID=1186196 RepID=A0A1H9JL54_9EURY|nr:helix-turn-helix domain-containing protein [Natrinema salaciae]SEQ87557.1 Sugar-specific transcriptional regulator TrmB [Natrinema salaciae]